MMETIHTVAEKVGEVSRIGAAIIGTAILALIFSVVAMVISVRRAA